MLNLPANFKNNIQGKDTALFPIVVIGDYLGDVVSVNFWNDWIDESIVLSTNSFTFDPTAHSGNMNVVNCKPLLLNIPSLKESVDIDKRNYKISSVNLDISNFPYEGQRFSEIVGESSLINKEIRIYWWSQSSIWLDIGDMRDLSDDSAFQVYFGSIRRYTHDDEKVRLVAEDRSQATLHKDLPLEKNYLIGEDVPDKYKNKPIPMVYGHVDRSPCVIEKTSVLEGNPDGQYEIVTDKSIDGISVSSIVTDNNPLLIYRDDYMNVLADANTGATIATQMGYGISLQYEVINNKFIVYSKYTGDYELDNINPIVDDFAGVNYKSPISNTKLFSGDWQTGDGWSFSSSDHVVSTGEYPATSVGEEVSIYFKRDTEQNFVEFTERRYKIAHNFKQPSDIEGEIYIIFRNDYSLTASNIQLGGNTSGTSTNKWIRVYYGTGDDPNQFIAKDITVAGGSIDDVNINKDWEKGWIDQWTDFTAHIKGYSHDTGITKSDISFIFDSIYLDSYFLISKFIESDFYANVIGRKNTYGYLIGDSPQIIGHIISEISDIEAITTAEQATLDNIYDDYPLDDWQYAFTVDKKINSKKLIEGIASASPYIPRFDNMGNFKFDVIPKTGGSVTTNNFDGTSSPNHHIKGLDVISYSFSRTKIEQVYTKIVFMYNWDYAREVFNDSVEADVDHLTDYKLDYYGFAQDTDPITLEEIHPDSTLVIDDDRGKYIRISDSHDTAQDFADWFLLWSCTQHLKMKVKLPLKYMNLEIGDFVDFDAILGEVKPYGINYVDDGEVNGQEIFKNFLITSTNKTLEWVEIECIQMHDLSSGEALASEEAGELKDDTVMAGLDIGRVKIGSTIA